VYSLKCGAKLEADEDFCPECGAPIRSSPTRSKESTSKRRTVPSEKLWGLTHKQQIMVGVAAIIALVVVLAVVGVMISRSLKGGKLYTTIHNYTGSTISVELYIDGEFKASDTLNANQLVEFTKWVSEGTHTITVSVPGKPSQSQTKYMPDGGLVSVEFSFY
jgi:ADP-ribosylglycohydrolase